LNAAVCGCARVVGCAILQVILSIPAAAQDTSAAPSAQPNEHRAVDTVKFLAGAALALGLHESGHFVFDVAFDAHPRLGGVHFGPFPFFAVTHDSNLPPRHEFTISSAGFWVQEATDEWLLTRSWCRADLQPCPLRGDRAWFAKGMLAFNVLNSVGYALVAFARAGPAERDTRGMATIGVDERAIGAIVVAPAALDAYRYLKPDARWAVWASRAAKAGAVLLVLKHP
jgi:hypothetical protein